MRSIRNHTDTTSSPKTNHVNERVIVRFSVEISCFNSIGEGTKSSSPDNGEIVKSGKIIMETVQTKRP